MEKKCPNCGAWMGCYSEPSFDGQNIVVWYCPSCHLEIGAVEKIPSLIEGGK